MIKKKYRRKKGNVLEREVQKYLERAGYATIRAKRAGRWDKNVDFFAKINAGYGFDILAKETTKYRWIQVKTTSVSIDHYRPLFEKRIFGRNDIAEVWTKTKGRREYKVKRLTYMTGGVQEETQLISMK